MENVEIIENIEKVVVLKKCFHCGIEKDVSDFGHNKRFKTGVNCRCKQCKNEDNKTWYRKKRENIKEQEVKKYDNEKKKEILDRINMLIEIIKVL
jgi:hypothetical protein